MVPLVPQSRWPDPRYGRVGTPNAGQMSLWWREKLYLRYLSRIRNTSKLKYLDSLLIFHSLYRNKVPAQWNCSEHAYTEWCTRCFQPKPYFFYPFIQLYIWSFQYVLWVCPDIGSMNWGRKGTNVSDCICIVVLTCLPPEVSTVKFTVSYVGTVQISSSQPTIGNLYSI